MHNFEVQPSELPQQYEVGDPVSYSSYPRYANRSYRFHPYPGPPSSKQATATLPYLKQGPPNAVVLPAAEMSDRLTQLPTMAQHVKETARHTHPLESVQQVRGINDIRLPTPTEYGNPVADVRCSQPVELVSQGQDDAVVYDYYVRKERRSSAPPERDVQHPGVTTENGRQRSRQSQFISVIKMPSKADMKKSKPNSDKTVLEEFASSLLLKDWKETCNASTQTESLPDDHPPHSSLLSPARQDQNGLQTSMCSVECQTDQLPEENPQLTPLVTPPLYGIDPKTGNAISVVFHFRLPKQNMNASMMQATSTAGNATQQ